jgi:hypothetical protein
VVAAVRLNRASAQGGPVASAGPPDLKIKKKKSKINNQKEHNKKNQKEKNKKKTIK